MYLNDLAVSTFLCGKCGAQPGERCRSRSGGPSKVHASRWRRAKIMAESKMLDPATGAPSTHSPECWRWHHACAVARIEAVLALCDDDAHAIFVGDVRAAIEGSES